MKGEFSLPQKPHNSLQLVGSKEEYFYNYVIRLVSVHSLRQSRMGITVYMRGPYMARERTDGFEVYTLKCMRYDSRVVHCTFQSVGSISNAQA